MSPEPSADMLLETPVGRGRVTPVKIPVARYTSPEFFEREMTEVWPRAWQLACTVDHVARPGDWHEYRIGRISVLIVRGDAVQRLGRRPGRDPLPVPPVDVGARRPPARGAVAT